MATHVQNRAKLQQKKAKLDLNYLKTRFTLDKREISVYYEGDYELAEQETRHLAQGAETLLNMRDITFHTSENLSHSQIIKYSNDKDIRNNYLATHDSSIIFMNRRLYELAVKFRIEKGNLVGAEDELEYKNRYWSGLIEIKLSHF